MCISRARLSLNDVPDRGPEWDCAGLSGCRVTEACLSVQQSPGFLDIYYIGANVLITEDDFFDLTMAYLASNVTSRLSCMQRSFRSANPYRPGVAFDTVIRGIRRALEEGERRWGITTRLIMCFLRAPVRRVGHGDPRPGQTLSGNGSSGWGWTLQNWDTRLPSFTGV